MVGTRSMTDYGAKSAYVLAYDLSSAGAVIVSGMAQGEFTETEYFELESPFGKPGEMICRTVDIVRKTRFAIAERHLGHLPHQTYPAVDGKQGPYGHP